MPIFGRFVAVKRCSGSERQTGSTRVASLAEKDLKQILGLPAGGVHKADAQRYLEKTIPELKLKNDLLAKAQQSLAQGNFQAARRYAVELGKNGDNPEELVANIDRAEQAQLKQLENQFEVLKQRGDDSAIQQLRAWQPRFQEAGGGWRPAAQRSQNICEQYSGGYRCDSCSLGNKGERKPHSNRRCEDISRLLGRTLGMDSSSLAKSSNRSC